MKESTWLIIAIALLMAAGVVFGNVSEQPAGFKSIHCIQHEAYRDETPTRIPQVWPVAPMSTTRVPGVSREVLGYYPYWVSGYTDLRWDLLTTIAYFSAEANSDGSLGSVHGWPVTGLIDEAHQNGVRVVLTVTCFSSSAIGSILGSPVYRSNLVNNLLIQVQAGSADGVNVDFEGVPGAYKDSLTVFMEELTSTFHESIPGSHITMATPAVDWSNAFDYDALAGITDGLMVMGYDYHWSGAPTTGPVAPLDGYTWDVTWTVNDYITYTNGQRDKIILGVPYYGFDWPCTGDYPGAATTGSGSAKTFQIAEPLAQIYDKLWYIPSSTPWYTYYTGTWHQCWYDDWASLQAKYDLFVTEDLQGIGIWALRYDSDRVELWDAIDRYFGTVPRDLRIVNEGEGSLRISWAPVRGASEYLLYFSEDGITFNLGTSTSDTTYLATGLEIGAVQYVKASSIVGGTESPVGEVLGSRVSVLPASVLVVHGFDRQWDGNTRDYIRQYSSSMAALGISFDACSNEAVYDSRVHLENYDAAVWILGNESTSDESFAWAEQGLVMDYLKGGGNLLISGSEIGWDLEAQGSAEDEDFYHEYLKTDYTGDDAGVYSAQGSDGGIFSGILSFGFDNGTQGTYDVMYPDRLAANGGSSVCLTYTGTSYNAAIQYEGTVPSGTSQSHIVNIGFGLETVFSEPVRKELVSRIMTFFSIESEPDVVPPRPVEDLSCSTSGNDLILTWSDITQDTLGSGESVMYYVIYQISGAYQAVETADSIAAVSVSNWTGYDAVPAAESSDFYCVRCVDTAGNASVLGNRIGALSYLVP